MLNLEHKFILDVIKKEKTDDELLNIFNKLDQDKLINILVDHRIFLFIYPLISNYIQENLSFKYKIKYKAIYESLKKEKQNTFLF